MARQDRQAHSCGLARFGTCQARNCVNPAHMICEPTAQQGQKVAASGKPGGNIRRITANRKRADCARAGRRNPSSGARVGGIRPCSGERLGCSPQTISRIRNHRDAFSAGGWNVYRPHGPCSMTCQTCSHWQLERREPGRAWFWPLQAGKPPFDRAREFSASAHCNKTASARPSLRL